MVLRKKKWIWTGAAAIMLLVYYFALPSRLFDDPYATVLQDVRGNLLSASIAPDGQWRFPEEDSVPGKYAQAIVTFEDKRFWNHPGVDILSLGRAMRKNVSSGKVVSGGSTITMQVIRLSRKGKSRTILEKAIEIILATRLELRHSKKEILALYASHAPFGGNVVGLEAACWRYFGRGPQELSWGEAAMLAVLPNAPSLIHLGKNRDALKAKRNKLLDKLKDTGVIDAFTCDLAKEELIPEEPQPLPRYARHLVGRAAMDGYAQQKVKTTIQLPLQINVERIIQDHHRRLKANQVFNAAAIVLDVSSGDVLAYAGNTLVKEERGKFGDDVDILSSPRSTGSILKPFLFAAMLDEGKMLTKTLVPDVPTIISGFAPNNFSKQYDGAVPADKALIRSLNIPAVHMLQQYRYEKFHSLLTNMGMHTLNKPPDHYGLSLILGGAEGTLWDISGMYASLARTLNNFDEHPGKARYDPNDFHEPNYLSASRNGKATPDLEETSFLSASSIYLTFEALKEVYRPGEETGWRYFTNAKTIAWKTGTSFGFRDGWAIGVTPDYVVGVWVGNASGEGRPGLTGTEAASPIMFDIFSALPEQSWFHRPEIEMERIVVCSKSGQRITPQCEQGDTTWITRKGLQSLPCAHHRNIFVTANHKYRLNKSCADDREMNLAQWFVLPPVQEFYYRSRNLSYKSMPPFRPGCMGISSAPAMDLIYPKPGSRIYVPRELDGTAGSVVFELAHHNPSTPVYWHLDGDYLGTTVRGHHFAVRPARGNHVLTVVDASGEALERVFEVISER